MIPIITISSVALLGRSLLVLLLIQQQQQHTIVTLAQTIAPIETTPTPSPTTSSYNGWYPYNNYYYTSNPTYPPSSSGTTPDSTASDDISTYIVAALVIITLGLLYYSRSSFVDTNLLNEDVTTFHHNIFNNKYLIVQWPQWFTAKNKTKKKNTIVALFYTTRIKAVWVRPLAVLQFVLGWIALLTTIIAFIVPSNRLNSNIGSAALFLSELVTHLWYGYFRYWNPSWWCLGIDATHPAVQDMAKAQERCTRLYHGDIVDEDHHKDDDDNDTVHHNITISNSEDTELDVEQPNVGTSKRDDVNIDIEQQKCQVDIDKSNDTEVDVEQHPVSATGNKSDKTELVVEQNVGTENAKVNTVEHELSWWIVYLGYVVCVPLHIGAIFGGYIGVGVAFSLASVRNFQNMNYAPTIGYVSALMGCLAYPAIFNSAETVTGKLVASILHHICLEYYEAKLFRRSDVQFLKSLFLKAIIDLLIEDFGINDIPEIELDEKSIDEEEYTRMQSKRDAVSNDNRRVKNNENIAQQEGGDTEHTDTDHTGHAGDVQFDGTTDVETAESRYKFVVDLDDEVSSDEDENVDTRDINNHVTEDVEVVSDISQLHTLTQDAQIDAEADLVLPNEESLIMTDQDESRNVPNGTYMSDDKVDEGYEEEDFYFETNFSDISNEVGVEEKSSKSDTLRKKLEP